MPWWIDHALSEALSDFVGGSQRCIRCLLGSKVPSPHHHPSAPRKPRTTSPSIPPPSSTPAQTPDRRKAAQLPRKRPGPRAPACCITTQPHGCHPLSVCRPGLQHGIQIPPEGSGLLVRTAWISRFAARAAPVPLHAQILLWTTSRGPLGVTNDGSYCAPAAGSLPHHKLSRPSQPRCRIWPAVVSRSRPSFPKALQALPSQRVIEPKQFIKIWRPPAWCRKSRLHATKPCQLG